MKDRSQKNEKIPGISTDNLNLSIDLNVILNREIPGEDKDPHPEPTPEKLPRKMIPFLLLEYFEIASTINFGKSLLLTFQDQRRDEPRESLHHPDPD